MNRQTLFFLLFLSGIYFPSPGQSFKAQFNDLVTKKDTAGQRALLANWKKADNNDPEFYVASLNYYFAKSAVSHVSIDRKQKAHNAIQIVNDSTKEISYINNYVAYEGEYLAIGLAYIDTGISKFPSRLDMRFGKAYVFGKNKDYENFTVEIIKTIHYSDSIKNKWTWADNKPVEEPEKFLLKNVHSYNLQLYNTNDDSLLNNMKRICEAVLKYYPNHIESLSDLAIVYLIQKEYDKALVPLLKAEKLAPTDFILLNNIAMAYKSKGDTKNAIKYYELTAKHGDEQAKKYAEKEIEALKKEK